ncbi:MAG: hypothetical protein NVSMB55_09170 [Mycobacteriales bacterium]
MTLADGTELSPALGIGAFADKTLVDADLWQSGRLDLDAFVSERIAPSRPRRRRTLDV